MSIRYMRNLWFELASDVRYIPKFLDCRLNLVLFALQNVHIPSISWLLFRLLDNKF